jgi:hypothetical protein
MSKAQNRVKLFIPVKSKAIKSTNPNDAQKRDCEVSNKLKKKTFKDLNVDEVKTITWKSVAR